MYILLILETPLIFPFDTIGVVGFIVGKFLKIDGASIYGRVRPCTKELWKLPPNGVIYPFLRMGSQRRDGINGTR